MRNEHGILSVQQPIAGALLYRHESTRLLDLLLVYRFQIHNRLQNMSGYLSPAARHQVNEKIDNKLGEIKAGLTDVRRRASTGTQSSSH